MAGAKNEIIYEKKPEIYLFCFIYWFIIFFCFGWNVVIAETEVYH